VELHAQDAADRFRRRPLLGRLVWQDVLGLVQFYKKQAA
jgi:hypothetical protein